MINDPLLLLSKSYPQLYVSSTSSILDRSHVRQSQHIPPTYLQNLQAAFSKKKLNKYYSRTTPMTNQGTHALTGVLTSFLLPHDLRQSFCLQCCSNSTSGFGNDGWNKLYALLTTQFYALPQHFNSGTLIDTRMTITPNRSLLTNETTDKGQRSSTKLLIALQTLLQTITSEPVLDTGCTFTR